MPTKLETLTAKLSELTARRRVMLDNLLGGDTDEFNPINYASMGDDITKLRDDIAAERLAAVKVSERDNATQLLKLRQQLNDLLPQLHGMARSVKELEQDRRRDEIAAQARQKAFGRAIAEMRRRHSLLRVQADRLRIAMVGTGIIGEGESVTIKTEIEQTSLRDLPPPLMMSDLEIYMREIEQQFYVALLSDGVSDG